MLLYSGSLGYPYVYDDHWTIEHNASLEWPLGRLTRALQSGTAYVRNVPDATRPTAVLFGWYERASFGSRPAVSHALSLLLFGGCIAAAWWAAFAMLRRRRHAHVAAVLFAAAPLHAEVVAAVHYREDLLAALGVLIVLARLLLPARKPHSWREAAGLAAIWAAALGAKESAFCLAPMVVMLAPLLGGRRWLARRERTLTALAAVLLVWGSWRLGIAVHGEPLPTSDVAGPNRLLGLPSYLSWALLGSLGPLRSVPLLDPPLRYEWDLLLFASLALLAAAAALPVLLSRTGRRIKALSLGLVWVVGGALATSPLAGPFNHRADRYLFVSVLGGAVVWVALLAPWARRRPRWAGALVVGLVVAVLSGLAVRDARMWRSDTAFFETAVARAPDSARAWTGHAYHLRRAGRLDDAEDALVQALRVRPRFARAKLGLVYVDAARGDLEAARQRLETLDRDARLPGLRRARYCLDERREGSVIACLEGRGEASAAE